MNYALLEHGPTEVPGLEQQIEDYQGRYQGVRAQLALLKSTEIDSRNRRLYRALFLSLVKSGRLHLWRVRSLKRLLRLKGQHDDRK